MPSQPQHTNWLHNTSSFFAQNSAECPSFPSLPTFTPPPRPCTTRRCARLKSTWLMSRRLTQQSTRACWSTSLMLLRQRHHLILLLPLRRICACSLSLRRTRRSWTRTPAATASARASTSTQMRATITGLARRTLQTTVSSTIMSSPTSPPHHPTTDQ